MPGGRPAIRQQAGRKRRTIHNPDALLPRYRQQIEQLRIVQAVVIVNQRGIDIQGREDPLPQIHRVDAEADACNPTFPLQFLNRLVPFGQGPLGVLSSLVLDVVDVDDIDIVHAQPPGAFIQRSPYAGARVVQGVVAVAAGLRVLAHLGGQEVAAAGDAAQRFAENRLRQRAPVGGRHVEVVDAAVQGSMHRFDRFRFVHRAEDCPQGRRSEAEPGNHQPRLAEQIVLHREIPPFWRV